MGTGELARAPKASCFNLVVSNQQEIRRGITQEMRPHPFRTVIAPMANKGYPGAAATGKMPVVPVRRQDGGFPS